MAPESILDLLYYALSPIIISCLFFFVGYAIINLLRIPFKEHFAGFFVLFTGYVSMNVLTALWFTKGITVMALMMLLFVFFVIYLKQKNQIFSTAFQPIKIIPNLLTIILLNLIWGLIFTIAYSFYIADIEFVRIFYPDNYFYALVGDTIKGTGQENVFGNINFNPNFEGGTSPYHYFMVYQNTLHRHLFGLNAIFTFLISIPISFAVLSSLLLISVMQDVFPQKYKYSILVALSVLFLFGSGFNLVPFDYDERGNFSMNIINHVSPKFLPVLICITLASWALYCKQYVLFIFPMLLLAIFSFLFLPVVLWTLPLVCGLLFLFKKTTRSEMLFSLGTSLITLVALVLFYATTNVPKSVDALSVSYSEVLRDFIGNPFFVIKRVVGSNVYYIIDYLLFFTPLAVLLLYYKKTLKEFKELPQFFIIAVFFFILFQGAITATWLLHEHEEGFQVQFFTLTIASTVLLFWISLFALNTRIKAFYTILFLVLGVCLFNVKEALVNHYAFCDLRFIRQHSSKDFYKECKTLFADGEPHHIAFIGAPVIAEVYTNARVLFHANSDLRLDYIDDKVLIGNEHRWYAAFNFYLFAKDKNTSDIGALQLEYIKKYKIKYICTDYSVPENHILLNHSKLIAKDERTKLSIREIIY